jgi:pyrimidine-nucleoside phosphorylase
MKKIKPTQKTFSAYQFIKTKRDKNDHQAGEISQFVDKVKTAEIPDYQISAWLMSAYLNGLNHQETLELTNAMKNSGTVYDFKDKKVIDKHSTGGIGDKSSFILGPIAASCGVKVPMITGRALGFTGGTADKIESIPGIDINISKEKFFNMLKKNHFVLIGQTDEIAPVDKKLYALRDVVATVESIPLITASIMSKKLAEGTAGLVFDVKWGSGSFMGPKNKAIKLAESLLNVCTLSGKKGICLITDMNQPLGYAIGNSIEIIECMETLKGKGPKDLTELSLILSAHMIHLAGITKNYQDAYLKAKDALESGKALAKWKELILNLGGNAKIIDDYKLLPVAQHKLPILAPQDGFIQHYRNEQFGFLLTTLGGGRKQKSDKIDHSVGFYIYKKIGDAIKKGEIIGEIICHKDQIKLAQKIRSELFKEEIIQIKKIKAKSIPLVGKIINNLNQIR